MTPSAPANVHFMSNTDLWETPQDLFDFLDSEFHFELDVCAIPENAKCERFFSPVEDGLLQGWNGTCWMNPPYGRQISKWVQKAYESSLAGATVVCLVPSRTDTQWFHRFVLDTGAEIRFLNHRLTFVGAPDRAPFPSAVVIFRPKNSA